jgi:hypothetical protein
MWHIVGNRFAIPVKVNQSESTFVNDSMEASQLNVVDADHKGAFQRAILREEVPPANRRVVKYANHSGPRTI